MTSSPLGIDWPHQRGQQHVQRDLHEYGPVLPLQNPQRAQQGADADDDERREGGEDHGVERPTR